MNAERDKCLLRKITEYGGNIDDFRGLDFSTWEGFGALFQWASQQSWWYEFLREEGLEELTVILYTYMIEPDRFADELRRFL